MDAEINTQTTPAKSISKNKKPVKGPNGRPLMYPDKTIIRMPKGFLTRINNALKVEEYQGDFMRLAVEKELRARRK